MLNTLFRIILWLRTAVGQHMKPKRSIIIIVDGICQSPYLESGSVFCTSITKHFFHDVYFSACGALISALIRTRSLPPGRALIWYRSYRGSARWHTCTCSRHISASRWWNRVWLTRASSSSSSSNILINKITSVTINTCLNSAVYTSGQWFTNSSAGRDPKQKWYIRPRTKNIENSFTPRCELEDRLLSLLKHFFSNLRIS